MITKTGVVYIQKDKFQLYSPYLASIVEFGFMPEIIRDLDIVNKGLLENLLKAFITKAKIPASNLIFVLADNTYFVKDFLMQNPAPTPAQAKSPQPQINMTMENLKEAADKYIEHVPYDNVVSKTFPMKNGLKVCAVNQDFYEAFKEAFEKIGFPVDLVIPGLVLGNNLSTKPIMDGPMALGTVQRAGSLKQYNLLTQQIFVPNNENEKTSEGNDDVDVEDQQNKKPNKKRLIAMIALLAVLIIILIIVFIQSQTAPPPAPAAGAQAPVTDVKQASTAIVATQVPTAPPPTQLPVTSPTVATDQAAKNIQIQIVNTSQSATQAQGLKTELMKYGFKAVTIQSQPGVGSALTIISFSSSISDAIRSSVLSEVKKIKSNVTVQERQSDLVEVSIILGNG